jgi:hypothetical protein
VLEFLRGSAGGGGEGFHEGEGVLRFADGEGDAALEVADVVSGSRRAAASDGWLARNWNSADQRRARLAVAGWSEERKGARVVRARAWSPAAAMMEARLKAASVAKGKSFPVEGSGSAEKAARASFQRPSPARAEAFQKVASGRLARSRWAASRMASAYLPERTRASQRRSRAAGCGVRAAAGLARSFWSRAAATSGSLSRMA